MMEASKLCSYSQEYLSLLARRGKIFSKKIGRNWYTTREAIDEYLKQQSVIISLPKKIFATALGGKRNFRAAASGFNKKFTANKGSDSSSASLCFRTIR